MCWLLHVLLQQRKHSLKDKHKNKRTYSIYTAGPDWTGPETEPPVRLPQMNKPN